MLAALWAAAERGVKVKILADGCNSWLRMTGNAYFYALASHENVTIKTYNPVNPLLPFRAMSRMHDKYVIVDDSLYLLGGRNVYDSFLGVQEGPKNYDRDVLVYHEGEKEGSIYQVKAYFEAFALVNSRCEKGSAGTGKTVHFYEKTGTWMVSKHIISRKNSGGKSDYTALEPDLPLQQRTAGVLWFVRTDEAGQKRSYLAHTVYYQ